MLGMKKGKLKFLYGFFAVFSSNFLSLLISVSITLIFPKVLSEVDYSYFQLYLFYSSFVIFGHLGIVDGIYLRYGGVRYKELEFPLLYAQFKFLTIIEVLMATIIFAIGGFEPDTEKGIVFMMCAVAFVLAGIRIFYSQLLLTTARMAEYAKVMLLERIVFISLSIIYFFFHKQNSFEVICFIDLLARGCSYLYVRRIMPELRSSGVANLKKAVSEIVENWSCGVNLYFSNFSSMLSIGIFRFLIENKWDIITFGKVSLAISAVGAFVVLSNAASLALFPAMRRINEKYIKDSFVLTNDLLCYFGLCLQWLYFPLCVLLTIWLPNYVDSFIYMGLLFPMCIYDIKWTSLESTILKVIRQEKQILYTNGVSLLVSVLFGVIIWLDMCSVINVMMCLVSIFVCKHIIGMKIIKRALCIERYSMGAEGITFIIVILYYIIVVNLDAFRGGVIYGLSLFVVGIWNFNAIKVKCKAIKEIYMNI